jgi:hypothetical protein
VNQRGLKFFICTRDRPQTLGYCIQSLAESLREALPGVTAPCYILDDSTSASHSAEVYRAAAGAAASNGLQLTVIGAARQRLMWQALARLGSESSRFLKSVCRTLGHGPWDLAGVRNLAFLLAYCSSDDSEAVMFLDDDILLTSSVYESHPITIDGASLVRQLLSNTPAGELVASGASYFGRYDGSILDHLRLVIDQTRSAIPETGQPGSRILERLRILGSFPSTLPVELALPGATTPEQGPGISGGLLATTPAALRSHFLPSCYNEDWIWLSLLGRPGGAIRKVQCAALHAAPLQAPVMNGFVSYQNTGEAVYRAVREVMNSAPPESNALEYCDERISIRHFVQARDSVIAEVKSLLGAAEGLDASLDRCDLLAADSDLAASVRCALAMMQSCAWSALASAEALNPAALHDWFREYLGQIRCWRSLLPQAREILCSAEVLDQHQV